MIDEKNAYQRKRFGEEDMVQLCGPENVIERDDELWEFGAYKADSHGFEINIEFMIIEQSCIFNFNHLSSKKSLKKDKIKDLFPVKQTIRISESPIHIPIIFIYIEHSIDSITREESILKFKLNNLRLITFSFHPNFSLNLPELSVTENLNELNAGQEMFFYQHNIGLLFECQPMSDHQGNISFSKTNEACFTLFITIYPGSNKCFARLTFVHYQEPVFQVTLTNITAIDVDLTKDNSALILKGKKDHEVVKILFNPTFSIKLADWIFDN